MAEMSSFSALKTGLNIILACNIPKNSPKLEVSLSLISGICNHTIACTYESLSDCFIVNSVLIFLGRC